MDNAVEELSRRARDGDLEAGSELVKRFYRPVFSYLRRRCGNDTQAADLTQKTFFKAWTSMASFAERSSFSTWIHGIANHVYLDWRRQKNITDPQTECWWDECIDESLSPFEDAAERDLAHRLYALVDTLGSEIRETVHLHYYQGLSLRETAEVLNVAVSTVKYRLHTALESLRVQLVEIEH